MTPHDDHQPGHRRFIELAALASTGVLTGEERAELRAHLCECAECTEILSQYRMLEARGLPMLAGAFAGETMEPCPDDRISRRRLMESIHAKESAGVERQRAHATRSRTRRPIWRIVAAGIAAVLVVAIAPGVWRDRSRTNHQVEARTRQLYGALAAQRAAETLAESRADAIHRLQIETRRARAESEALRARLQLLQDRVAEQLSVARRNLDSATAEKTAAEERARALRGERDRLSAEYQAASDNTQNLQAELTRLGAEQSELLAQQAALQRRVRELASANRDQERRLADSEQYLSADRDIRELMGARNLYIADVFDVDSSSRTRRPFGRVFYTRGKSLIFYAFDLDRQQGVRTASAFQVWGQKDTAMAGQSKPFNLGILYMDNETSRRWSMHFDDPRTLADIDAVFVTVEPRGGSERPTGKPFLFAMLRKEANHP